MGGFTKIQLKDTSQVNIDDHNENLKQFGVSKRYRFYSEKDVKKEYEYYQKGDGNYPEHLFPKDQINSYEDFKRFWSPEALGEVFVPKFGSLTFDCYFGRTSEKTMHGIARWVLDFGEVENISTSGSYSTFVERSGYKSKTRIKRLMKFD